MFPSVNLAVGAVRHVMDVTNALLVALGEKKKAITEEISMSPANSIPEEIDQEVLLG
jgi:hypothetical protein